MPHVKKKQRSMNQGLRLCCVKWGSWKWENALLTFPFVIYPMFTYQYINTYHIFGSWIHCDYAWENIHRQHYWPLFDIDYISFSMDVEYILSYHIILRLHRIPVPPVPPSPIPRLPWRSPAQAASRAAWAVAGVYPSAGPGTCEHC